jgi:hypothetical protein
MKKFSYGFSARYQDVDFTRIVEENSDSDFIRVEWKNERKGDQEVILLTPKGVERCRAVEMGFGIDKEHCEIKQSGTLWLNENGPFSEYVWWLNTADFEDWYGRLREREERRRPIKVTAIS